MGGSQRTEVKISRTVLLVGGKRDGTEVKIRGCEPLRFPVVEEMEEPGRTDTIRIANTYEYEHYIPKMVFLGGAECVIYINQQRSRMTRF